MTSTTTSTTMRAVTQDRYGGAEVLRVAEVAPPLVGDHEEPVRSLSILGTCIAQAPEFLTRRARQARGGDRREALTNERGK